MLRSDTISSQRSYGFWQKLGILVDTIIRVKNWHIPILFYLGMGKKEDIVLFRDGTKCILRDKSDATGFYENFFLKTNVGEDIIIDVGAHVGFFSIYAAKKASKGMVYAFEPSQESFRNLQRNIKLNNLDNVIAENYGILKNTGTAELFVNKNTSMLSSMFTSDSSSKKETVSVISLQEIIEKHQIKKVDLLKLDCEGAEYEIILNLSKNILEKISKFSVETHPYVKNHNMKDLLKFFETNNFKTKIQKPILEYYMLHVFNARIKE